MMTDYFAQKSAPNGASVRSKRTRQEQSSSELSSDPSALLTYLDERLPVVKLPVLQFLYHVRQKPSQQHKTQSTSRKGESKSNASSSPARPVQPGRTVIHAPRTTRKASPSSSLSRSSSSSSSSSSSQSQESKLPWWKQPPRHVHPLPHSQGNDDGNGESDEGEDDDDNQANDEDLVPLSAPNLTQEQLHPPEAIDGLSKFFVCSSDAVKQADEEEKAAPVSMASSSIDPAFFDLSKSSSSSFSSISSASLSGVTPRKWRAEEYQLTQAIHVLDVCALADLVTSFASTTSSPPIPVDDSLLRSLLSRHSHLDGLYFNHKPSFSSASASSLPPSDSSSSPSRSCLLQPPAGVRVVWLREAEEKAKLVDDDKKRGMSQRLLTDMFSKFKL